MDSGNSESLQSSSDDHDSISTLPPPNHSSLFLPPFQQPPSSSSFYGDPATLSFVNNLISDDILNQNNLLPLPPQPPPHPPPPPPFRNPRKRTRASRRAPTTVLTTDTSNFRAMVQEFTGVPTSPFSHPFSSTTRRFDIFRSPSSDHPLSYNPFRPIPQKPHLQPSTSMNFPDLPLHHNQQVSTFQSLLSHQHQTTLSSLQDLDSINLGALQKNHPDVDHQLMMRQFSEFENPPDVHNNICSSSSSDPYKVSSGTTTSTTTTTTTVDPRICPRDSNN